MSDTAVPDEDIIEIAQTSNGRLMPLTRNARYRRSARTELDILRCADLPPDRFLERIRQQDSTLETFIGEEAIIYFIRQAASRGDRRTINTLFEVLLARAVAFFRGKIRGFDRDTRRDIEQDVMRRLIEELLCEDDRGDFAQVAFWSYLERRTIDAIRAYRAQWEGVHLAAELVDEEQVGDAIQSLSNDPVEGGEDALIAMIDISRLPSQLQQVFIMRFVMKMTEKEIAAYFGKTDRTIRTWLAEAREQLRRT